MPGLGTPPLWISELLPLLVEVVIHDSSNAQDTVYEAEWRDTYYQRELLPDAGPELLALSGMLHCGGPHHSCSGMRLAYRID